MTDGPQDSSSDSSKTKPTDSAVIAARRASRGNVSRAATVRRKPHTALNTEPGTIAPTVSQPTIQSPIVELNLKRISVDDAEMIKIGRFEGGEVEVLIAHKSVEDVRIFRSAKTLTSPISGRVREYDVLMFDIVWNEPNGKRTHTHFILDINKLPIDADGTRRASVPNVFDAKLTFLS